MSAIEAQNIAVVRRGYEAFAKGDIETLKTLFATNATLHSVPAGILQGNYRGVQAILELFGRLAHETDGTVRAELQTWPHLAITYSLCTEIWASGGERRSMTSRCCFSSWTRAL